MRTVEETPTELIPFWSAAITLSGGHYVKVRKRQTAQHRWYIFSKYRFATPSLYFGFRQVVTVFFFLPLTSPQRHATAFAQRGKMLDILCAADSYFQIKRLTRGRIQRNRTITCLYAWRAESQDTRVKIMQLSNPLVCPSRGLLKRRCAMYVLYVHTNRGGRVRRWGVSDLRIYNSTCREF